MECGVGFERDQNDDGLGHLAWKDAAHDAFGIVDWIIGVQFGATVVIEHGVANESVAAWIKFHVGAVGVVIGFRECELDDAGNVWRVCKQSSEGVVEASCGPPIGADGTEGSQAKDEAISANEGASCDATQ